MRSSLPSSSSPRAAGGGSGRIGTKNLVPRCPLSSTTLHRRSALVVVVGAVPRRPVSVTAAFARPTRASRAAAAAGALPNGATASSPGSATPSLRDESGDAPTNKPTTSTSTTTAATLVTTTTPQTSSLSPPPSSSPTPPVAPPPPPPPPPSLLPILQRFAASLAASLVRLVAAFFSALGGRDLGRRAAALAAGALVVAVAGAGAAAGRAVVARSSASSSWMLPPPVAASGRGGGGGGAAAARGGKLKASSSSPLPTSSAAARARATAAASAASAPAAAAAAAAAVRSSPSREVPYSQFLRLVKAGRVRAAKLEPSRVVFDVVVDVVPPSAAMTPSSSSSSSSRRLFGLLPAKKKHQPLATADSESRTRTRTRTTTRAPQRPLTLSASRLPGDSTTLVPLLLDNGVEFAAAGEDPGSVAARILAQCLALWLPLSPLLFLMSRALGGRAGGGAGGPGGAGFGRRAGMRGRGGGAGGGGGGAGGGGFRGSKQEQQQQQQLQRGRVTFADVAGADGAKRELAEAVSALRDPAAFAAIGARAPSGILLYGPPGTGKTLLARAVAGEAGVPFFAVSASEFVELYVGRGAARVRDLFADARRAAPCVVFIDELDAIGARRGGIGGGGFGGGGGGGGSNDERDQTLNQLLTEMDGFDAAVGVRPLIKTPRQALKSLKKKRNSSSSNDATTTDGEEEEGDEEEQQQLASSAASSSTGVLLLAATNRPEVLDPALVRPGRLSRRVAVPLPDERGRTAVLGVHLAKIRLEGGVGSLPAEAARLARLGAGLSGAQLADVANDAALLALRRGATSVAPSDLDEALDRVAHGVDGRYGGSANNGAGGGGIAGIGGIGAANGIAKALRGALMSATAANSSGGGGGSRGGPASA